jgi:hypothetical protein
VDALDFFLSLPERSLIVGFAFLYDLTKILADIDDTLLYLLVHEEKRARVVEGRIIYRPIPFHPCITCKREGRKPNPDCANHQAGDFRYEINFINRRLTVVRTPINGTIGKQRRATIWDTFRFYQSKFTQALIDWKIADKERLTRMAEMKEKRAIFDRLSPVEIHAYCQEECTYLAKLTRGLIEAHKQAGLKLKHFYGAGSTASAFLEKLGIRTKRGEFPAAMREPLASAFFGGRFENSVIGPVDGPIWNYDISSAYPYQATLLPCLQCGHWDLRSRPTDSDICQATLALIHWGYSENTARGYSENTLTAWGCLPVRASDDTIAFPLAARGGWTWKQEYLAARKLNPDVYPREAWLYQTDCEHRPFADIPQYYRERVRLGKDSAGIVLKLGTNSIYGKLAQSVGLNPPFQSWIWSGNITSGCRAQLLDGIGLATDPWNVLSLATDGIQSRERLALPTPADTGTFDLAKPLGGWEEKCFANGAFYIRPGIYFPLAPAEEQLKEVRARGLGKKVLYEIWGHVLDEWWAGNREMVEVGGISRFIGIKSGLSYSKSRGVERSDDYGEWIDHSVKVRFHPHPKRQRVIDGSRLKTHDYFNWESCPYKKANNSPEAILLRLAEQIAEEQPDAEFADISGDFEAN